MGYRGRGKRGTARIGGQRVFGHSFLSESYPFFQKEKNPVSAVIHSSVHGSQKTLNNDKIALTIDLGPF